MKKYYRVIFGTTAYKSIVVEAKDISEAQDIAVERIDYADGDIELGTWELFDADYIEPEGGITGDKEY